MKVLVLFAIVALAAAEPPRYRQRSAAYTAPAEPAEAPYPPSGWRPSGRQFALPSRQAPQAEYSAPPKDKYGPPPAVYGPPTEAPTEAPTTTEEAPTTTEEIPTTTDTSTDNPEDNEFGGANNGAAVAGAEALRSGSGVYYVLLPDGRLQRVAFTTTPSNQELQRLTAMPEPANTGFFAVQYQDVQPIKAPVYAYGSPLVRLFK